MENGNLLSAFSNNLADLVDRTSNSIVTVNASRQISVSGVHWREGLIVTVEYGVRQSEDLTVTIADGITLPATLIGRDPGSDLALLRVSDLKLTPATLGDARSLKVGHMVLAVARDSDRGVSASLGILNSQGEAWRSSSGGKIDRFLRPSFMLYPGFAGSALVNMEGQIVGINTTSPRQRTITIPASTVDRVVNQLVEGGKVKRGYLGLGMQSVYLPESLVRSLDIANSRGVIVVSVEPTAAADRAGIMLGDILVKLDGHTIEDIGDVQAMLDADSVDRQMIVQIIRSSNLLDLTITVGEKLGYEEVEERYRGRGRRGWGRRR
jgi:S1-C subfamily serine protease